MTGQRTSRKHTWGRRSQAAPAGKSELEREGEKLRGERERERN